MRAPDAACPGRAPRVPSGGHTQGRGEVVLRATIADAFFRRRSCPATGGAAKRGCLAPLRFRLFQPARDRRRDIDHQPSLDLLPDPGHLYCIYGTEFYLDSRAASGCEEKGICTPPGTSLPLHVTVLYIHRPAWDRKNCLLRSGTRHRAHRPTPYNPARRDHSGKRSVPQGAAQSPSQSESKGSCVPLLGFPSHFRTPSLHPGPVAIRPEMIYKSIG